jgi:DNA polymerase III subunit delta'
MITQQFYFHANTRASLERYVAHPFHAALLTGPEGVGKDDALEFAVAQLTGVNSAEYPYYFLIDGRDMGIDAVRELRKELGHRFVPAQTSPYRIVALTHFDKLGVEAQNALLKIIEEPPAHTLLILSAADAAHVPATISSRVVTIEVLPVSKDMLPALAQEWHVDMRQLSSLWQQHQGRYRLLKAAALGEASDDATADIAKRFVSGDTLQRLTMITELSALDRQQQAKVLQLITTIIQIKLKNASLQQRKQYIAIHESLLAAQTASHSMPNAKLFWLQLSFVFG